MVEDRGEDRANPPSMSARQPTSRGYPTLFSSSIAALALWPTGATAQTMALPGDIGTTASLALILGLTVSAAAMATALIRQGRRAARREEQIGNDLAETRHRLERAQLLLRSEPFVIVTWGGTEGHTEVTGDAELVGGDLGRMMPLHNWLPPHQASELGRDIDALRGSGKPFMRTLWALDGHVLEAQGRAILGRAVMRIRDVTGERLEAVRLRNEAETAAQELEALRETLNHIPHPIWQRDRESRLRWVNAAYARAVEARDASDAVEGYMEFLDSGVRQEAARRRAGGTTWSARIPAIFAGHRRMFDASEIPGKLGSTGYAVDISELEDVRSDLQRQMDSQLRTLDQLPTAVAIFDDAKRLVFCNAAYRTLWALSPAFIDQRPTDPEILDVLRAERRLPEQADYKIWKSNMMQAYRSFETSETVWHLPDGRALRVVVNPNPKGGVTYLFDDLTERLRIETEFKSAMRVQTETLESLAEGVAVFGTDGRLKLSNPAFATLWRLDTALLKEAPHIDAFILRATALYAHEADWASIRAMATSLGEARQALSVRMERYDGSVLDVSGTPLPDGSTLLTFADISAAVNVERALKERNDALEQAGALRDSFVHHVSYQLRSPLTNVIGFTEMLGSGVIGALNDKQVEYVDHIMHSSNALLTIIDDILDLASIDIGSIELQTENVDIRQALESAADGLQDRIAEQRLRLIIDIMPMIGTYPFDPKRLRQIVYNLLSNAVGFSQPGQTVTLSAERTEEALILRVADQGRGIPKELIESVFNRFESHTQGSRHRGVGLGLSIVRSFVELHGGRVGIESREGHGTIVTCLFPANGFGTRIAAA
jgi:signal transduction histidine kinase